jgi:hypothetical protein
MKVSISLTSEKLRIGKMYMIFSNVKSHSENCFFREGQQLIDTRKIPNGVYLFQIVQEGKKVSDGKFVVTH